MNNVQLVGRVTKDLVLSETKKGVAVTNFPLAVNEYLGKERGTTTDYPYLTIFGSLAESCVTYLRKGSMIGINGRLQTQKRETAAGKAIFSTDIIVKSIEFLSKTPETKEPEDDFDDEGEEYMEAESEAE